jgi:hypothetical protein
VVRGGDERTGALFSCVELEACVWTAHPLRLIRRIVNAALSALAPEFSWLYSQIGQAASSVTSSSTRAMTQPSSANQDDFFNSLLGTASAPCSKKSIAIL